MKKVLSKITILSIIGVLLVSITSNCFAAEVKVSKIKLNKTKIGLTVGKTAQIKVTISPSNAKNKKVTYTSSNKNVATVSSTGVIKAVSNGFATITVKSKSNSKIKAKCKVSVNDSGIYVSKDVLKIITHNGKYRFTRSDYEYFVRTMYKEAGGTTGSQIMMEMCAATMINLMEQDSYSGRGSLVDVLKRTCTATSNLTTFNNSKSAEKAVKKALAGSDPTSSIKNAYGGQGAVAFSAKGRTNANKDESVKVYTDSSGRVVCLRNKNVYFKSIYNLNLSNFN